MNRIRRRLERGAADSTGMTLVEVIVAIAIMSIIATSAIGLAISSTTGSVSQQRQAIAVTVANAAMEKVSGLPTASLYGGRSKASVSAAFTANSGISGVSKTYQEYDHTLPLPGTPTIDISSPVSQNGTIFTVTTLIGTCFERLGTNTGQTAGGDCAKLDSADYAPVSASVIAGYTPLTRVIVIVGWTAGQGCAVVGTCTYTITTLLDSHADLEWATN